MSLYLTTSFSCASQLPFRPAHVLHPDFLLSSWGSIFVLPLTCSVFAVPTSLPLHIFCSAHFEPQFSACFLCSLNYFVINPFFSSDSLQVKQNQIMAQLTSNTVIIKEVVTIIVREKFHGDLACWLMLISEHWWRYIFVLQIFKLALNQGALGNL